MNIVICKYEVLEDNNVHIKTRLTPVSVVKGISNMWFAKHVAGELKDLTNPKHYTMRQKCALLRDLENCKDIYEQVSKDLRAFNDEQMFKIQRLENYEHKI